MTYFYTLILDLFLTHNSVCLREVNCNTMHDLQKDTRRELIPQCLRHRNTIYDTEFKTLLLISYTKASF